MIAATHSKFGQIESILRQLDGGCLEREDERRGAPRLNVRMSLEAIVLSGPHFSPIRIHTRNLSSGGVGFVSRRLLTAGERIVISLSMVNRPAKLILAQVTFGRYVKAALYEMGAQFLEAVDDPENLGDVPKRWTIRPTNLGEEERSGVGTESKPADAAGPDVGAGAEKAKGGAREKAKG